MLVCRSYVVNCIGNAVSFGNVLFAFDCGPAFVLKYIFDFFDFYKGTFDGICVIGESFLELGPIGL